MLPQDIPGFSMTQYEALLSRIEQLQTAFDHSIERETDKAAFIAETRYRLLTIEKQIQEYAAETKEQLLKEDSIHMNLQADINDLKQQAEAIIRQAEQFPHDVELQWKSVTTFLSGGAIVFGAIWAFIQGLWWIYHNLIKTGN